MLYDSDEDNMADIQEIMDGGINDEINRGAEDEDLEDIDDFDDDDFEDEETAAKRIECESARR